MIAETANLGATFAVGMGLEGKEYREAKFAGQSKAK